MRSYAWWRTRCRGSERVLKRSVKVGTGLWRLEFTDGRQFNIVSPERVARYLKPGGLDGILESMRGKYLDSRWDCSSFALVLDVGANVGEFTLSVLQRSPQCRVVCFEPDARVLPALRANLVLFPTAVIEAVALGSQVGEQTFYSSWRDADSSLIQPVRPSQASTVDGATLDQINEKHGFPRISLLKIDAEGAEPEVLAGARSTLACVDRVTVDGGPERHGERTAESVKAILRNAGFTLLPDRLGGCIVLGERDERA